MTVPGLEEYCRHTYGFDTYGFYSISTASYTLSLTVSLAPAPDLSLLSLASCPLPSPDLSPDLTLA